MIKHARADHLQITLVCGPDTLRLTVTDDGAGGATVASGTGLQGLHDRADAAGGQLAVDSPAGGPTVLVAEFPLPGQGVTAPWP